MPDNNELHIAAKGGDLVQVQSQVRNFDVNAKGVEDGTALYWSARSGHAEVVKLLLTFNPDVNIPDVSEICPYFSCPIIPFYSLFPTHLGIYFITLILSLLADVLPFATHDFQYNFLSSFYQMITSFPIPST